VRRMTEIGSPYHQWSTLADIAYDLDGSVCRDKNKLIRTRDNWLYKDDVEKDADLLGDTAGQDPHPQAVLNSSKTRPKSESRWLSDAQARREYLMRLSVNKRQEVLRD